MGTESIKRSIDDRVSWINKHKDIEVFGEYYEDYYDGNDLIRRDFDCAFDQKSYTERSYYELFYNKDGFSIYDGITHYRAAAYSMYFHNDELLYTKVEPFLTSSPHFIDGGLTNVENVIKEEAMYSFVIKDIAICLENAYK